MPWDDFWRLVVQVLIVFVILIVCAGGILEIHKGWIENKKDR